MFVLCFVCLMAGWSERWTNRLEPLQHSALICHDGRKRQSSKNETWIQVVEMSFLRGIARLSLSDKVRSIVIQEELGVDLLLLCTERSQLRWFQHLIRMPPAHLSECFPGTSHWHKTQNLWRNLISPAREDLKIPLVRSWKVWLGRGMSGFVALQPNHEEVEETDRWIKNPW